MSEMTAATEERYRGQRQGRKAAEKDLRDYVDQKILHWRGELKIRMAHLEDSGDAIPAEKAIAYLDAYQTLLHDLFGKALPDE